jgi:small subunit ribosomal protein S1
MERVANKKAKNNTNKFRIMSQESDQYIADMLKIYGEDTHDFELALEVGSIVEGTLLGYNSKHILVDIGYKDYVMIDYRKDELLVLEKMYKGSGDKVEVMLTDVREEPYQIMGSFISLDKKGVYDDIMNNMDSVVVVAKVLDWSPAGFKVEVNHEGFKIPAFMPNTLAGINKLSQAQAQTLVGTTLSVMVEAFQGEKGTFVVSRKKYLQTLIPQALENIQIKDEAGSPVLYTGVVTGTTKFGVFVEFNECLTGMIHSVNLTDEMRAKLNNGTINPADTISFHVKENVRGKLILTQVWRVTLWDTIAEGDTFEVTVKDVKKIGALVQLDEETLGLVHNKELEKAKRTVKAGEAIKVKVQTVNRMDRKIFLAIN